MNASRRRNIGNRLAIVLDKKVLSAPTIQSKISDNGVITGIGSHEDAADLALNLRAGSLPAGVEYLEERTRRSVAGRGFDPGGTVLRASPA